MKYLKYIITSAILVSLVSCDAFNDPDLPIPLDETMDNTGAFLRIVDVETAAFDILTIEEAGYVFTAEYWDNEGQSLLDNVQFYSNYTGAEFTGDAPEIGRTLFKTVQFSEFTSGETETGWPSKRFELTVADINAAMGISSDDNLLGDRYQIDWVLNLTDGRTFTSADMSPAITGGFFSSPNAANVSVVAKIPEDEFVGPYEFTQLGAGTFGVVYSAAVFEADLRVNPENDINGRIFDEEYLGTLGFDVGDRPQPFAISLANDTANNSVTLTTNVGAGLGCSALGLYVGPEREQDSQFDLDDDSDFLFNITENAEGDCGAPPTQVLFNVVKL